MGRGGSVESWAFPPGPRPGRGWQAEAGLPGSEELPHLPPSRGGDGPARVRPGGQARGISAQSEPQDGSGGGRGRAGYLQAEACGSVAFITQEQEFASVSAKM